MWASWWLSSKESTSNAGDEGLIPELGRSPGGENGNPLQYSCLKSPMDKGAWGGDSLWGRKESDIAYACAHAHTHTHTHTHTHRVCVCLFHIPHFIPPPPFPFGNHLCFLCLCVGLYLVNQFISITLLDSTYDIC